MSDAAVREHAAKSDAHDDSQTLRMRIASLEEALAKAESENTSLCERLATADEQSKKYLEQFIEAQLQANKVANLYVASSRLHSVLDKSAVLDALQDIVINLIGSEEIAIFETDDRSHSLKLLGSYGVDPRPFQRIPFGHGIVGEVAESGVAYFAQGGSEPAFLEQERSLTACIPLVFGGMVTGTIAIFKLLSHKPELERSDHELLELLTRHAALALYCAKLHAEARL